MMWFTKRVESLKMKKSMEANESDRIQEGMVILIYTLILIKDAKTRE